MIKFNDNNWTTKGDNLELFKSLATRNWEDLRVKMIDNDFSMLEFSNAITSNYKNFIQMNESIKSIITKGIMNDRKRIFLTENEKEIINIKSTLNGYPFISRIINSDINKVKKKEETE